MPGLAAVASKDKNRDRDLTRIVTDMCVSMCRHDWERYIVHADDHVAVGSVYLGSAGGNHYVSNRHRIAVFVDGEIYYEYDETGARHSVLHTGPNPAKLVADLYRTCGIDFVMRIEGAFSVVLSDADRGLLFAVNDRYGLRPLCYASSGEETILCSQVSPILSYTSVRGTINHSAVFDLMSLGYVRGEDTYAAEVKTLPPASILTVSMNSIEPRIDRYWEMKYTDSINVRGASGYAMELASRLKHAVRSSTGTGRRVALLLSGGLDSRTLLACAGSAPELKAYTFGQPGSRDIEIAKEITQRVGMSSRHRIFHLDGRYLVEKIPLAVDQTDGLISCLDTVGNTILERVREEADVCLDGMQLLGSLIPITPKAFSRFSLLKMLYRPVSLDRLSCLTHPEIMRGIRDHRRDFLDELVEKSRGDNIVNILDKTNILDRQRRYIMFGIVVRRHYLEVRSPLFDYRIMDFIMTVPPLLRAGQYIYVRAFCEISPELAQVVWEKTGLPLSASMARVVIKKILGKARGFVGAGVGGRSEVPWYANVVRAEKPVQTYLSKTLLGGECVKHHVFKKDGVDGLLNRCFNEGNLLDILLLSRLLTLEIWFRKHPGILEDLGHRL